MMRTKPIAGFGVGVASFVAALAASAGDAHAADFYAGKTISFIAGTDVGGGFSIYARAISKYLPRHIPGEPTVVVRNMPGAGGATAAAWLYRIAPKDGTAIASVSPNAILGRLLDGNLTQYEPAKFIYLAGAERSTRLCMTFAHSRVRTIEDALVQRAQGEIGAVAVWVRFDDGARILWPISHRRTPSE